MSRGNRKLLESVGEAAENAGSEAIAAISNFGGGDAGGTVGRLVSAVAGETGGFAPKVITSVTKHGIAGIDRVEPMPGVDRGYRAVAADANGLESIRTIIELDPREYDVTVTREEGAGVVEFVQHAEPDPEPAVEPAPPVREDDGSDTPAVEPATSEEAVQQAEVEARKARAEAEAEKAKAEAETARAEAEAAKARARAEQTRAGADARAAAAGGDPQRATQHDGGTSVPASTATQSTESNRTASTPAAAGLPPGVGRQQRESESSASAADDSDPAFSAPSAADGWAPSDGPASDGPADTTEKWGVSDDAGASTVEETAVSSVEKSTATAEPATDEPLQTDGPLEAETVDAGAGGETTVVDDEFGSFVAADPVDAAEGSSVEESSDEGIGNWADSSASEETGGFEF